MIKWSMFALLLWLGVALLAALAEYAWISDADAAAIKSLWSGWNIIGTIIGIAGVTAMVIAGSRGARVAMLAAGIIALVALRGIVTFDYPTIFYGPYEILRWAILLIMLSIFIIPVLISLVSQGTAGGG
jgi:hypothetical protein